MRLTSIAATIITVALAGYPVASSLASRATATGAPQGTSRPGPMVNSPGAPPQSDTQQSQPAPAPQAAQSLQVATTIVNVFATVRDKHNAIINDLGKEDFKIYEDGVEQKVSYFTKEVDMPITLGLLMDTSGSMFNILNAEQDAASRFVREVMRKKDEAMIMSFDTDANLMADFTEDPSVLDRAIHRTRVNVDATGIGGTGGTVPQRNGGTILYDAVYLACNEQLRNEAGRKAVILLTDAEDTGSKVRLEESVEAAQRADAVVHVILITDAGASQGYGPGVASKMAGDTGGRVINVRNGKALEAAFNQISEELRSQYVLGYYPTNAKRDGAFRKIKVEATRPDTKILARKGYYAPVR